MGRRPLRICHLAKFYPPAPGGMESHVQCLALAQAELGAHVQVLCVNHRGPGGRDVTWDSLAVTPTVEDQDGPVAVTRLGKRGNLARLDVCPSLPGQLRRLGRLVDIVHVHAPNPTMTLALAAFPPRTPIVVTHHSDVIRQRLLGRIFRPVEKWLYRRAAALVATSPAYAAGSSFLQQFAAKLNALPLGIPLEPFLHPSMAARAEAQRLRTLYGEPLWLSVGRLVYYKGLPHALRALTLVPGRWLLVGEGPLEGKLRQLAVQEGVADRVIWRGHVSQEELIGAYHAATALWFPSNARSEGFGLVQIEAMASGCPVINTDIPGSGVSWVSRHEESGFTIPMDDPHALADASQRLLDWPELRARFIAAGRRRVQDDFDSRLMGRRSLALYEQALASAATH